jgi:outer membrane protein assembly factor BamE (lipoprotein component of BamABCDE complex)
MGKLSCILALAFLAGCGADYHASQVQNAGGKDRLTVGTAQRELQKGMAADKVVDAMGSPNIVTTDEQGREVWVYDKFATDVVASESHGWWIVGGGSSGAASKNQRTLTVVVKFDESKKVRDIAYHSSSF